MKAVDASAFVSAITNRINDNVCTCYFEEAPKKARFIYAVISGELINDLEAAESGKMITFDVDIYADEKEPTATTELLATCDKLQNDIALNNLLSNENVFYAHLGIESQSGRNESEADLYHKRVSMSARIFFIGG